MVTPGNQANFTIRNWHLMFFIVLQVLAFLLVRPLGPVFFLTGWAAILQGLAASTQAKRALFAGFAGWFQAPATDHRNHLVKNSQGKGVIFDDDITWFVSHHVLTFIRYGVVSSKGKPIKKTENRDRHDTS